MGNKLSDLEPKKVFKFFNDLTKIPRGSGNEKAVSDYLVDFASKRGLLAYQDELNNVTILKPATTGMEDKETVILQAHMDMVCVADDPSFDFTKKSVDVYVDGDYIMAKGTTLGADDGIGIALILAVLDNEDVSHPMLEAVFTANEETGLGGVFGYDASRLKGKRLINIDTEEENHIVTGCAGGIRYDISSKCKNGKIEGNIYEIGISGLAGGHSGTDIDRGSANANVLMGRLFALAMQSVELSLGTYDGGIKENAIAATAVATVVVKKKQGKAFEKCVKSFCEDILAEYGKTDPDFVIKCKDKGKGKLVVMSTKDFVRFTSLLNLLPNGVMKMSQKTGMVETSANTGIASAKPKGYSICYSLRSNRESALDYMVYKTDTLLKEYGVQYLSHNRYPAWESEGSDYALKARELYKQLFDRDIKIESIHAGVETAVLTKKIKGVDAISIGPDISGAHTTSEKLSISSTKREWEFLTQLLKL